MCACVSAYVRACVCVGGGGGGSVGHSMCVMNRRHIPLFFAGVV